MNISAIPRDRETWEHLAGKLRPEGRAIIDGEQLRRSGITVRIMNGDAPTNSFATSGALPVPS